MLVQQEVQRLEQQEHVNKQNELKSQQLQQQKVDQLKKEHIQEQQKLQQFKKEMQKMRQDEEARLSELKIAQEKERKRLHQLDEQRQEEQDRLNQVRREREKEQKRLSEVEQRKKEATIKKAEIKQAQLLKAKIQAQHEEKAHLDSEFSKYSVLWHDLFKSNWHKPIGTENLVCDIKIAVLPDGTVHNVTVIKSSGNQAYDESAVKAVWKSSPIRMPDELQIAERLREVIFGFKNE